MLYTLFDRGVPRPLAFVFRPDWIDHVGELTLCVLAHGGNQDVTNFINAEARLPDLMSRTFGTFVDDDGAEVEPAETESYHPSKLVFVAVAGIGWSRTEAGGWNSELGEGTQLLGPPDVDFFARLPAIAERLFGELFERTFFVRPKASVFARDLFFGFSSGAGLGFRIAAERPGVFEGYALSGANVVGYTAIWERDLVLPPWRYSPPFEPGTAPAPFAMYVTIGTLDDRVWWSDADSVQAPPFLGEQPTGVTVDKMGRSLDQIDPDAPAPGWNSDVEWGVTAWFPIQLEYADPVGVAAWAGAVNPGFVMDLTLWDTRQETLGADGGRFRLVISEGMGHIVASAATAVSPGGYDWVMAAAKFLL